MFSEFLKKQIYRKTAALILTCLNIIITLLFTSNKNIVKQKNVKFCYFCPCVTKPGYKQTCEEP